MILKSLAKDAAIYGAGDMIGKFVAFLTFPAIAAAMTPRDFGVLDLIMTSVALISLIIGSGISNSAQRYYWDANTALNERKTVVSTGFFIQIFFGLLFLLLSLIGYWAFSDILEKQDLPVTWIAVFSALILTPSTQWMVYIRDVTRLQHKPWNFLILSVLVKSISAILALVVVVFFDQGLDGYLLVQALILALSLPFGFWMIREDLTLAIDKGWLVELVKYGFPFIFVIIAHWLFGSMDRWMLAAMASVSETGIYSVSFRFSSLVVFVATAFGLAWSPQAIKIKTDHPEDYPKIYGNVLLYLIYVMLFFGGGLALFSGELIGIIMPEEYTSAAVPLAILSFAAVLQSSQQVTAVGISISKKTSIFANLAWITAAFNLVGNYILIPIYGSSGAALATALSYLILTIAYLYYTQKLHPLQILWKKILWLCFLGCVVAYVSTTYNSTSLHWNVIAIKCLFALTCMGLGAFALPFNAGSRLKSQEP